jgi:hypothetical protein
MKGIARIRKLRGQFYWTVYRDDGQALVSSTNGYDKWDEAVESFDQTKEIFASVERPPSAEHGAGRL